MSAPPPRIVEQRHVCKFYFKCQLENANNYKMSARQNAETGNGITARRGLTHGFCETSRLMSMQHYMFANYFNLPDGFPRAMLSG